MSFVFGIDLGTTYSAISYIDEFQRPILITNRDNTLLTPSVVHFKSDGTCAIGKNAENSLLKDSTNIVSFVKREMGKNKLYTFYDKDYTPQKISALILKKLINDAQVYLKQNGKDTDVKDVVITVPAHFGMEQKSATKEAGELAGLNVLMILNEPTAAALAYSLNRRRENQTVFVFDLGGGTFDVSILEINGNDINIIASDGNAELGGKDWDDVLLAYCASKFQERYGEDPQDFPDDYQWLYERVVSAKKDLSYNLSTTIFVRCNTKTELVEITQEQFENITSWLLDKCKHLCQNVLEKAGKQWTDIDTILMVGGSTYMPMVRNMVTEISGKELSTDVNPDQCVAIGAAYQAKYRIVEEEVLRIKEIHGEDAAEKARIELLQNLRDIKIHERVSKSLGTDVLADNGMIEISEIIAEQSLIPSSKKESYSYSYNGQTSLTSLITEGKGKYKDDVGVIVVGEVKLINLPPRNIGDLIEVIYTINRDKTLDVEIIDVQTGTKGVATVTLSGGTSPEDLAIAKISIERIKIDR
jgi:molecular chaperone DnaK